MLETKKRKAIDIIHKYEIVVNNDRLSTSELAKKYQVADSTISTIKKNKALIELQDDITDIIRQFQSSWQELNDKEQTFNFNMDAYLNIDNDLECH